MPESAKRCRHVKEDGTYCQCPALRGREYCYFHLRALGRQMKLASENARHRPHRLVLPPLEDMNAVQVALMQVLDALAGEVIDQRTAGLMLYGLQQAATNLRSVTAVPTLAVNDQREGQAEEYPDFEAQFQLPLGLDLSVPPEMAFPPPKPKTAPNADPETVAEEDRARPWQNRPPFDLHEIQPEDIELEEIRLTGDLEAYDRRWRELDIKAYKKSARAQYEKDHARHIMEAERRNQARRDAERARREQDPRYQFFQGPEDAPEAPVATPKAAAAGTVSEPASAAASPARKPPVNAAAEPAARLRVMPGKTGN